jgi:hypothetical protein
VGNTVEFDQLNTGLGIEAVAVTAAIGDAADGRRHLAVHAGAQGKELDAIAV